jgi:hypothetical protein
MLARNGFHTYATMRKLEEDGHLIKQIGVLNTAEMMITVAYW